jgi:UDP-N-acetylmuramoyl-L-alanyl-D-glutamate--2,6-diaminopimelate ligase
VRSLREAIQTVRLSDLLKNMPVKDVVGNGSVEVKGITKDSRAVREGYMYFATKKSEAYIADAAKAGAAVVVAERDVASGTFCAVTTDNVDSLLGLVASRFYGEPSSRLHVTGITGTNGKTTTTYLLESIYEAAGRKAGVIGTISYRYGGRTLKAENTTPGAEVLHKLLCEMLLSGVESVVMEVSSHALDQRRVEGVQFDAAVFTNLTHDHLDYHGTLENYRDAKKRLFRYYLKESSKERRCAILNIDDPAADSLIAERPVTSFLYSLSKQSDAYAVDYTSEITGLRITISLKGNRIVVTSPLLGSFNILNILCASLAAHAEGIPIEAIIRGIKSLEGVPGRLERVKNAAALPVFIDYAHTPDALKNVLELLVRLKKGKLILVFGCGGDRDKAKRPLMGEIASRFSDFTIITSDNPRNEEPSKIIADVKGGFQGDSCKVVESRRDAIFEGVRMAGQDDVLLVAGKGHEDYQIIGSEVHHFSDREVVEESLHVVFG